MRYTETTLITMELPKDAAERVRSVSEKLESFDFLAASDKANILFVSLGLKPGTSIEMHFQPNVPSYSRQDFEQNITELEDVFRALALSFEKETSYDKEENMELTVFYVAASEQAKADLVAAFAEANDQMAKRATGRALGIPETATEAFISGDYIKPSDLPEGVRESSQFRFAKFYLSKKHWQEELELVGERQKKLEQVLPGYFEERGN